LEANLPHPPLYVGATSGEELLQLIIAKYLNDSGGGLNERLVALGSCNS
jgi:hypothetical protein